MDTETRANCDDRGLLRHVLVLGADGLFGAALLPALARHGASAVSAPAIDELDIVNARAVARYVAELRPTLLINLAAASNVDRCEDEPEQAFRVNAIGAENLAYAAAERDVPLLHISTDYVFDGMGTRPYREHDPSPWPASQYGQSKRLGERLVQKAHRRHYIVRVAALFGPGKTNFVDWVVTAAQSAAAPPRIITDSRLSPTYTVDAAEQCLTLVETNCFGTYHATNQGECSWFELASAALERCGLEPSRIIPVTEAALGRKAPRPAYSVLENHLLALRGLDRMPPWQDALARYLGSR